MKENRQNLCNWLHKLQPPQPPFFGGKGETCHACQIFLTSTVLSKREQKWPPFRKRGGKYRCAVMCERTSRYGSEICQTGSYHSDIFKIQFFNSLHCLTIVNSLKWVIVATKNSWTLECVSLLSFPYSRSALVALWKCSIQVFRVWREV